MVRSPYLVAEFDTKPAANGGIAPSLPPQTAEIGVAAVARARSTTISILEPDRPDQVLAKQYKRLHSGGLGRCSYDRPYYFSVKEIRISGIDDLARALEILQKQPRRCYIRGKLIKGADPKKVRRLLIRDEQRKQRPTFEAQPSRIIALDFDDIAYTGDTRQDPEVAIRFLVSKLPAEFATSSFHWAFTGSHGAPDKKGGIRARLHFWADRDLDDDELRRWADWINAISGERLIDPALFNPVQVCYTAAPVFIGLSDWCPVRSGFIRCDRDDVALILPPEDFGHATKAGSGGKAARTAPATRTEAQGFEATLALVGGPDGYRGPLWRAMLAWWRANGADADPAPLVARLKEVCATVPSSERSASTLADYISDGQIEAARRFIDSHPIEPDLDAFETIEGAAVALPTADEAAATFRTALDGWLAGPVAAYRSSDPDTILDGAPQAGAHVGTGIGKTTATIASIVATKDRVAFFVPSHVKTLEVVEQINAMAGRPIAARWLGRDREDPSDTNYKMCPLSEAVAAHAKAGGSHDRLCGGQRRGWCQHHPKSDCGQRVCGYRQQEADARIWVLPHSMLSMAPPAALGRFDLVVIDESPWLGMIGGGHGYGVSPSDISLAGIQLIERTDMPGAAARYDHTAKTVAAVCDAQAGRFRRADFDAAGVTAGDCGEARAIAYGAKINVDQLVKPGMSKKQVEHAHGVAAAKNAKILRVGRFWSELAGFLRSGEAESACLKDAPIDSPVGKIGGISISWRKEIDDAYSKLPTLHLDATMNEKVARWFLPNMEMICRLDASMPHAKIKQVFDSSVGYGKIAPSSADNESTVKTKENNLAKIARLLEVEAFDNWGGLYAGPSLLVAPLSVKLAMNAKNAIPEGIEVAHFYGCRGVDRWRATPKLIVLSRPLPPPSTIEELTGILSGRVPEMTCDDWYDQCRVRVRAADGSAEIISAPRHPDEGCEAVRWQCCEAELIQVIGRARACRRTASNPVEIIIGTNVPLAGIPISELIKWDGIFPNAVDLMAVRGIVPGNYADIGAMLSELWPDAADKAEAARNHFRNNPEAFSALEALRAASTGESPIETLYRRFTGTRPVRYRKTNSRQFSTAHVCRHQFPNEGAARAALSAAIGAELLN